VQLVLAAHNAGPRTVDRYKDTPPIPETRSYVRRITAKLVTTRKNTQRMDWP
jgi:soluble lytic murein transglycosylase-like protein